MTYSYQVEFTDDVGRETVLPYGNRLRAAIAKARRESDKDEIGMAYVVALKQREQSRDTVSCGHKAYYLGCVCETEGEGF